MNIGPTAKVLLFEKSTLEYLQLVVVGPLQYVQKEVYIYIYGITLNLETVLCNTPMRNSNYLMYYCLCVRAEINVS